MPGSGNFQHAGRPGKRGGSAPNKSGKLPAISGSGPRSPAFRHWFGKSKVVNEDGSPRVVFHGTQADFTQFMDVSDSMMLDRNLGFHFAEDPNIASRFALGLYRPKTGWGHYNLDNGNVMPVYLSIKKPRVISGKGSDQWLIEEDIVTTVYDEASEADFLEFFDERWSGTVSPEIGKRVYKDLKAGKGIDKSNPDLAGAGSFTREDAKKYNHKFSVGGYVASAGVGFGIKKRKGKEIVDKYKAILKRKGYDGIKYQNTSPMETQDVEMTFPHEESYWKKLGIQFEPSKNKTTWVVFEPTQIKSAFNMGTYDPENPDILKERLKAAFKYELKGGAGSGNFGHAGRPGKKGGSSDRASFEKNAGYMASRHNKKNDAWYVLYNAKEAKLDTTGGNYATVCEKHNTICNHRTKKLALYHLPVGDWCEDCQSETAKGVA